MYKWISLLALVTTCGALSLRDAGPCFPKDCVPPACVCSSEKIPYAGWDVKDTPQMILLVFEGSINDVTYSTYYKPLFEGVTNPNGCPASGTFFVSHKYTDYSLVNDIWTTGSDIAPQSITGQSWNSQTSSDVIYNEIAGEKYYLELYAGIPNVEGMRAPSGQSGGDHQFAAGVKAGLSYDVTLSSTQYSTPFWPYTLDFKTSQDCLSCPCPTQSYKGFWEFPVTSLIDGNDIICSNLFSCAYNSTMKDAYSLLNGNYKYHQAQAAPFVIIVPLPWLFDSDNAKGLNKFLKEAVGDKTYVVTLNQALAWLQSPTKTSELAKFQPWQCAQPRPKQCSTLKCKIKFNSETINFNFCTSKNTTLCPPSYPWVNNLPWNSA